MKAIFLGVLASFFFAVTFVLNRAMNLSGGSWIWSAALRYFFMAPPLLVIVAVRKNLKALLLDLVKRPWLWLGWSTVGFGLFYAPLCFSSVYGPAWLVASMWQITIVAGSLLAPFLTEGQARGKIPLKGLWISFIILAGVGVIQSQQFQHLAVREIVLGVLPVIVAAFAYPLGNRKMMAACGESLDTFQRVLGMTLASLPFWLLLSLYGLKSVGLPSGGQVGQSLIVALSSGVVATILFFKATDLSRRDLHKLAAVEATQSGEIIFSLAGEILILNGSYPNLMSLLGIGFVILGMILHSFSSGRKEAPPATLSS